MPIVEKLKMIKEEKGLTNMEIANVTNTPLATITRIFNKQTLNPTFETISAIAIGMGVSLDELVGLKQPDEPPLASPIENTLNSYVELLKEKDERIKELKEDKEKLCREKYRIVGVLACVVIFVMTLIVTDLINGHFGYFRY